MRQRLSRLIVLLGLVVMNTGCFAVDEKLLTELSKADITIERALFQPSGGVENLVKRGVKTGWVMTVVALLVLALYLAGKFLMEKEGQVSLRALIKENLWWLVVCFFFLTNIGSGQNGGGYGLIQGIYRAGEELGELYEPAGGFVTASEGRRAAYQQQAIYALTAQSEASKVSGEDIGFLGLLWRSSAQELMERNTASGNALLALTLPVVRSVAKISMMVLIIIYWTLTPLMAPLLLLPFTRPIFASWLKSYISICLWPMFFGLIETIASFLPWEAFTHIGTLHNPLTVLTAMTTNGTALVMLDLTLFMLYITVPLISAKIVNQGSGAVKAGFF